jgi:hypothetical protein
LRKQNFGQVGRIDGHFGQKTEDATKFFQVQRGIPVSGEFDAMTRDVAKTLGYKVVPDNHYDEKTSEQFPPRPEDLRSPSNQSRNRGLGCFKFKQLPLENRSEPEEIIILGSCNGEIDDWRRENIVDIEIPQLRFATAFTGVLTCHKVAAPHIKKLFARWEELDLLHLVRDFDGTFNPRYIRGHPRPPMPEGHAVKRSLDVEDLSNHAFGAAMDVNAEDNPRGANPILCPRRGCVRELVVSANELGFFWGGHFATTKDGMHFEFANFEAVVA